MCHPEKLGALQHQLEAAPTEKGQTLSRWTLRLIQTSLEQFEGYCLSGIWRWLRSQKIHYKRGQQHMHSPDPLYLEKVAQIQSLLQQAREQPDEVVVLFLDEFSFYRWALSAPVYAQVGKVQPKVNLPCRYNTVGRTLAVMNAVTAQVHYCIRSHITVAVLAEMMTCLRQAYPLAKSIYVVQDNWHNVHFHARQVQAAQEAQITLFALPTYSSWLNPIEKLWRKLKQDILLMHRNGDDWEALKQRVSDFLSQFALGSPDLLKYVGLIPN